MLTPLLCQDGRTALYHARGNGYRELEALLRQHGATRATEWVQQGEDSREVSAADLQHCDWCGAGSLTMLKCGACRLVYYCSVDCQKAARDDEE